MAYDSKIEVVRTRLLNVVGAGSSGLATMELWDAYLTATGYVGGSLIERMARSAAAQGKTLQQFVVDGPAGFGPELAPVVGTETLAYTLIGTNPPVHDATGITFTNTSGGGAAWADSPTIQDNISYRASFTMDQYTSGAFRLLVYGATLNHAAAPDAGTLVVTGPGTYTYTGVTNKTGSSVTEIRMQCQTGPCTGRVTAISVKKVL